MFGPISESMFESALRMKKYRISNSCRASLLFLDSTLGLQTFCLLF
jgi:hypothetical protein